MAPRRIAVANQKGGVAKTNLAVNLSAEIANMGRTVVLVDLDPQATATLWTLGRVDAIGTAEALLGEASVAEALLPAEAFGVRVLASVPDRMRLAERHLAAEIASERRLHRLLRDLAADCVIDCPPSMGILSASAIYAATEIITPVTASIEALDGLVQFRANLARLCEHYERTIPSRVVPTTFDGRTRIAKEALTALRQLYGDAVTKTVVRRSVKIQEAVGHHLPIRAYEPNGTGAADYAALAQEILNHD